MKEDDKPTDFSKLCLFLGIRDNNIIDNIKAVVRISIIILEVRH